jgi:hypothetical protein
MATIIEKGFNGECFQPHNQRGIRLEFIPQEQGFQVVSVVSFRNIRHRDRVVAELVADNPIAFHGWGVEGVGKRVDEYANNKAFWFYKEGRPLGAKIPLLEPPKYTVNHVDWEAVHPDFRYLEDFHKLKDVWKGSVPFHVIFPYCQDKKSLSDAVVTPAFDPDIAPHTPVPTICIFWIDDPAVSQLVKGVKQILPEAQIGVSSLNDPKETPSFNTRELIAYLKAKRYPHYKVIVEDPLLEPVDVASSHSQFVIPLKGEDPVWKVKRRGSLSPAAFMRMTGFDLDQKSMATAKVASRRAESSANLDDKVSHSAHLIHEWARTAQLNYLKSLLRIG